MKRWMRILQTVRRWFASTPTSGTLAIYYDKTYVTDLAACFSIPNLSEMRSMPVYKPWPTFCGQSIDPRERSIKFNFKMGATNV